MENITTLADRAHILARLWINERDNEAFEEYMEFNDLGLPLAYSLSEGIIESNTLVEAHINDSFDMLLTVLKVEDTGFTDYMDIIEAAGEI
jgi:hypothetical protein